MRIRNAERLADSPGPGAKEAFLMESPPGAHNFQSGNRFDCPDQNARAMPFRLADEIQAPVNPIGAIYIRTAGGAEHYLVSLRGT